ncbi:MAG: DUF6325 family protein [Nocardioides sp.]
MSVTLKPDQIGPVDVAVIAFVGNQFNGDVAPALQELNQSGVVRIVDLAFVLKDEDGTVSSVEVEDAELADVFSSVYGDQFDLLSDDDLAVIGHQLDPNTSALVVVWENSWAARLAAAIRDSHGTLIEQERIPRETVLRAIAALDEE